MENKKDIIYLTGFMGAGKSTIGPILANTLGWEFFDLDKVIEEIMGEKVRDIFEKKGEKYFREVESKILKEISDGNEKVISLGGGTLTNQNNLNFIKNNGRMIFLKTSPEAIYQRLKYKRDRPSLIKPDDDEPTKEELIKKILRLYNSRRQFYEQADFIFETDNIPVGITVDEIVKLLQKIK